MSKITNIEKMILAIPFVVAKARFTLLRLSGFTIAGAGKSAIS